MFISDSMIILLIADVSVYVCVVMAGSAPEGTKFDACQFYQKLDEV